MASAPRHLRIFVASPGDVAAEREIALAVLDDLPYDPLLRGEVTIEHVAWDKRGAGAPILAGVTPQESIAAGLPQPRDCHIVVVIFWSRMGTPLPAAQYRKDDGSGYESGTEWEYENAVAAFREKGSPYVLLYLRKPPRPLEQDDPKFDEHRLQYQKVKRFFARLQNDDGSANSGYVEYAGPGDFRKRLEDHLRSLIARILETPAKETASVAVPEPWPGSPFPGLRAFTADDAPIFFGREREIDALVARIAEHALVAVVGASGSGKSSLIAAGVIPRLQLTAGSAGAPKWLVLHFTPDRLGTGDPFTSLAAAVLHALPETQQKGLAAKLRDDPQLLGRLLPPRTFVFIDQFEELFTTVQPSLRAPFVDLLETLVGADGVRILVTVRADFYGNCVEMPALAHLVENSTTLLAAPGVAALYDMITRPAARAALTFEEGLAQRILDETGQQPGALALMAYTLDELYRRGLTHAAYEELGAVQGAIGKRSESVFSALCDEERAALPGVFRELVEVDERGTATRQRAPLARVAATPAAQRLTEALTEARLLVQSRGENNEAVVEVAHEALFRSWSRLAEWIRDAADDLRLLRQVRVAAAEWDRNARRDDFLWSHERLEPVYALRERMGIEFDEVVKEFIRPEYERLAERVRTETRDFRQRSYVDRLIEIGAPAAGVLVQSLQYTPTEARRDIFTALVALGDAAIQPLIDACLSAKFTNRSAAIEILVSMKAHPGADVLRRLLEDEVASIRGAAIHLAAIGGDAGALPLILQRLDDPVAELQILALFGASTFDDDRAVEALASAVGSDSQSHVALDLLAHILGSDRSGSLLASLRTEPMKVIGKALLPLIQENAPAFLTPRRSEALAVVVAPRIERVEHPQFKTAVTVLSSIGNAAAVRAVLNAMRTRDDAYVLRVIRRAHRSRMVPALIDSLNASEPHLRESAARLIRFLISSGMESLREEPVVARLLQLADDDHVGVSLSALYALSQMRHPAARQVFRDHLASPHEQIRRAAIEGLGRLRDTSSIPELLAALHDRKSGPRIAAAGALLKLGPPKSARDEVLAILDAIADSANDGPFKAVLIRMVASSKSENVTKVLERVRHSTNQVAVRAATEALKNRDFPSR